MHTSEATQSARLCRWGPQVAVLRPAVHNELRQLWRPVLRAGPPVPARHLQDGVYTSVCWGVQIVGLCQL
jgi:hypothetical protein